MVLLSLHGSAAAQIPELLDCHRLPCIVARLTGLPRRAVVLAEDETHLNLLPHVRATWTVRGARPEVRTPGTNQKITVLGAIELTTGRWVYRLGRILG
jgi:hypothetical protein